MNKNKRSRKNFDKYKRIKAKMFEIEGLNEGISTI